MHCKQCTGPLSRPLPCLLTAKRSHAHVPILCLVVILLVCVSTVSVSAFEADGFDIICRWALGCIAYGRYGLGGVLRLCAIIGLAGATHRYVPVVQDPVSVLYACRYAYTLLCCIRICCIRIMHQSAAWQWPRSLACTFAIFCLPCMAGSALCE